MYSLVERGAMRVKCLTQEHNAVTPAKAGSVEPGRSMWSSTSALTLFRLWGKIEGEGAYQVQEITAKVSPANVP